MSLWSPVDKRRKKRKIGGKHWLVKQGLLELILIVFESRNQCPRNPDWRSNHQEEKCHESADKEERDAQKDVNSDTTKDNSQNNIDKSIKSAGRIYTHVVQCLVGKNHVDCLTDTIGASAVYNCLNAVVEPNRQHIATINNELGEEETEIDKERGDQYIGRDPLCVRSVVEIKDNSDAVVQQDEDKGEIEKVSNNPPSESNDWSSSSFVPWSIERKFNSVSRSVPAIERMVAIAALSISSGYVAISAIVSRLKLKKLPTAAVTGFWACATPKDNPKKAIAPSTIPLCVK